MSHDERMCYLMAGIIAMAISLSLLRSILLSNSGDFFYILNPESLGTFGNIAVYLLTGLVFFISFFVIFLADKHNIFPKIKLPILGKYGILIVATALSIGIFLAYELLNDVWIFSSLQLMAISLGISGLSIVVLHYENEKPNSKWLFFIIVLFVSLLWGFVVATPNTFASASISSTYNVHHSSAYIDSIYSVMYGQPYLGGITDQYGHYALFFYTPLKIIGGSALTVSILLGILSAVSFLCIMGAVHVSIKSNYLKSIIALAGGVAVTMQASLNIYWQTFPHRLFFPSMMILFIALVSKKKLSKRDFLIGSTISILSILWNFESGIALIAAWLFFIVVNYHQYNDFKLKEFMKLFLKILVILSIYLLIPFIIVNLYNLLVTGLDFTYILSFKMFLGSMSDTSYIDILQTKLKWENLSYFYAMFLFLGCIVLALRDTSIISKAKQTPNTYIVAATASIIGLALLTMWMNRTVSTPSGVYIFIAVASGLVAYGMITEIKKLKKWKTFEAYELLKVSMCSLALIGLVLMGTTAMNIGETLDDRYSSGCYDYDDFVHFTKEIEANVPKDTLAIGQGTAAIYMELGWDKGYYLFGEEDDALDSILSESDSFFIESQLFNQIDSTAYNVEKEFVYKGQSYRYYVGV